MQAKGVAAAAVAIASLAEPLDDIFVVVRGGLAALGVVVVLLFLRAVVVAIRESFLWVIENRKPTPMFTIVPHSCEGCAWLR